MANIYDNPQVTSAIIIAIGGAVAGLVAGVTNNLLGRGSEEHKIRKATAAKFQEIRFAKHYDNTSNAIEGTFRRLVAFINTVEGLGPTPINPMDSTQETSEKIRHQFISLNDYIQKKSLYFPPSLFSKIEQLLNLLSSVSTLKMFSTFENPPNVKNDLYIRSYENIEKAKELRNELRERFRLHMKENESKEPEGLLSKLERLYKTFHRDD